METISHFIDGQSYLAPEGTRFGAVMNPATGQQLKRVALATAQDVDRGVASAKEAFLGWSETPPMTRGKILRAYLHLLEENQDKIAEYVSQEHGKSVLEAKGSLQRGLDVLEYASGCASHLKGTFSDNVARQVDCHDMRQPLGVCVGITPFNFPVMIPLWIGSLAMACGNSFVLKPSEKDPSSAHFLAELAAQAGIPKGVFNVVHGDKEAVDALLTHPDVQAISFVGQTRTAKYIQETAIQNNKRVQAFGGAKNHLILMPDADLDQACDAVIGAAYGSAGERCMAISVVVAVGDQVADALVKKMTLKVQALKIGPAIDPASEMGPLITKEHRQQVLSYIDAGVAEGAKLVVDGRGFKHPNYPEGYYVGGCLFDHVTPAMNVYEAEIFGPVLCIVRVPDYGAALKMVNSHPYGNGTAIFTRDGDTARHFAHHVQAGMVGINVPIPVPAATHSFGGWKDSAFSDIGMHGREGLHFFTKLKTVTSRWPSGIREGIDFSLPQSERR